MIRVSIKILFFSLLVIFLSPISYAATIGISTISDLVFGKFAAGSGGTVVISPAGARSSTGGVVLLSSSTISAANFHITGDANLVFSITLPNNGDVNLSSGGQSMPVTNFTVSPASPAALDSTGNKIIAVGGALTVDSGKQSGDYNGAFNITVNYQ